MRLITVSYVETVERDGKEPEEFRCNYSIPKESYDAMEVGAQRKVLQNAVDMVISQVGIAVQTGSQK